MASRGKGARAKGFAFEREVAKLFTEASGYDWQRGLGQTRGGGAEVADVVCEQVPGLHVECKRQIRVNINAAMQQATEDAKEGALKVAVTKSDRQPIFVTMTINDWLPLFTAWVNSNK